MGYGSLALTRAHESLPLRVQNFAGFHPMPHVFANPLKVCAHVFHAWLAVFEQRPGNLASISRGAIDITIHGAQAELLEDSFARPI
jgi:hypothetical protein